MGKFSNFFSEFKVNDYLILRLETNRTNIYIKGKMFRLCKFLLLSIPKAKVKEYDDIESIDEAAERIDSTPEGRKLRRYHISAQTEFFGHCSNLQAWYENISITILICRISIISIISRLNEIMVLIITNPVKRLKRCLMSISLLHLTKLQRYNLNFLVVNTLYHFLQ
ncbi:MAG: hypothetical protein HWN79_12030 [Candidatus Lokiarchaeota archaeon]|nr:hypothetical protein [Candidatus Lokiarchaeota archaeon]